MLVTTLTTLLFIFYPSLNLTAFLFLYYLFSYFMYICPFLAFTISIAIQYIFVLNYHMSITYAYVYNIILYTKIFDSLSYNFIGSNQSTSFLLIKTCNTIDIFIKSKTLKVIMYLQVT